MRGVIEDISRILDMPERELRSLDAEMAEITGRSGVLQEVAEENARRVFSALQELELPEDTVAERVLDALRERAYRLEEAFLRVLSGKGGDAVLRAMRFAEHALLLNGARKGFFLKKEAARKLLEKRPPPHILSYADAKDVNELLKKRDITDVFAALRFMETRDWMHRSFDAAYRTLQPDDFEERSILFKVLGKEWRVPAREYVAHKHHNVSHLKELGVIFWNPIDINTPGALFRDFALLFHYYHEIHFYADLFRRNADLPDFAERLMSLLRGDVPEKESVRKGEWLIIQRYLWKENPNDPRLFLPRVNPEALHWARAEQDIVRALAERVPESRFWDGLDWVAGVFENRSGKEKLTSFDMEDTMMSAVSFAKGVSESFYYHKPEAMWIKLFQEYVGGEAEIERLLKVHYHKGSIMLSSK